ncbi:hypothetical protein AMECASPLE_005296 [Ameca splendens]|uniref:Uncharacterized protein n=1 Tax=Ameca splendens TaxID=208324 RepID=A0ABV0YX42_9TELE
MLPTLNFLAYIANTVWRKTNTALEQTIPTSKRHWDTGNESPGALVECVRMVQSKSRPKSNLQCKAGRCIHLQSIDFHNFASTSQGYTSLCWYITYNPSKIN